MIVNDLIDELNTMQGSFGVFVRKHCAEEIMNYHANDYFPLASTAKVVLGAITASRIAENTLSWDFPIKGLVLDPKEDSAVLYPHLQNMPELPLSHVVEIMIACHDHHCANAVANVLGGWDAADYLVRSKFPKLKINSNPRDEENNVGELAALLDVFQCVIDGYRLNRAIFEPVIAGLVRMADKTSHIPQHHQWNMTGGLTHALVDVGILGNPMSESYLIYALAGKNLLNRDVSQEADDFTADLIRKLHEKWQNGEDQG